MGLMNKQGEEKIDICHPDYDSGETCKCNLGGPALSNECDVVERGGESAEHACRCEEPIECSIESGLSEAIGISESQILAAALEKILDKIDTIEKGQEYILKKLL